MLPTSVSFMLRVLNNPEEGSDNFLRNVFLFGLQGVAHPS
jgi:hypothetical protein